MQGRLLLGDPHRLCLPSAMSGNSRPDAGCLVNVRLRRTLDAYTCLGECKPGFSVVQLCAISTSSFKHLVLTGNSLGGDKDLGLVHTGISATNQHFVKPSVLFDFLGEYNKLLVTTFSKAVSTQNDESAHFQPAVVA